MLREGGTVLQGLERVGPWIENLLVEASTCLPIYRRTMVRII